MDVSLTRHIHKEYMVDGEGSKKFDKAVDKRPMRPPGETGESGDP
jgi:hypothetical protein